MFRTVMSFMSLGLVVPLMLLSSPAPHSQLAVGEPAAPIAIPNVTVIDGTGGPVRPDVTVLIADSRVAAVEPSDRFVVPAGAQVGSGSAGPPLVALIRSS
ncbi:MAG: hypothetical protein HY704_04905 [Gemmatimonadetes bacterium]|nr:hypothetical protein [Gemmatimonadota bacterium]